MQTHRNHSTHIRTETEDAEPKRRFPLAYIVLILSFATFVGSIWFSSDAKQVALQRQPIYERKKLQVQDEIQQLELKESTLTRVQRIRDIARELGMVEPTRAAQVVWDK